MRTTPALAALLTLALASAVNTAHAADFSFTFAGGNNFAFPSSLINPPANPTGSIFEGEIHNLIGTFTNTSNTTLYFDQVISYPILRAPGLGLNFQNNVYASGPYSGLDFTYNFILNAGGIAPGQSFTGPLSYIVIDSTTTDGFYSVGNDGTTALAGVTEFRYYTTPGKTDPVRTAFGPNLTITIGAIPEPTTLAALLPALALLTCRTRR